MSLEVGNGLISAIRPGERERGGHKQEMRDRAKPQMANSYSLILSCLKGQAHHVYLYIASH